MADRIGAGDWTSMLLNPRGETDEDQTRVARGLRLDVDQTQTTYTGLVRFNSQSDVDTETVQATTSRYVDGRPVAVNADGPWVTCTATVPTDEVDYHDVLVFG